MLQQINTLLLLINLSHTFNLSFRKRNFLTLVIEKKYEQMNKLKLCKPRVFRTKEHV